MNQNGALDVPEKNSYETYEIIVLILLNQEQKPSFCPKGFDIICWNFRKCREIWSMLKNNLKPPNKFGVTCSRLFKTLVWVGILKANSQS